MKRYVLDTQKHLSKANENLQHMFSWKNKKKYQYYLVETNALFQAILSKFFAFIDHKSKMTQIDSL